MTLSLTVAICTWNRCERLRSTLDSLTKVVVPQYVHWDVVVVNNNSTDATDAVVAEFAGRLPLRCVHEPRAGVSFARNTAARTATGDYVFWLDDDVLVPPTWMESYVAAVRRHAEAAVFGGPIRPFFEVEPPEWIARHLDAIPEPFGLLEPGPDARRIEPNSNHLPFGANCVVRREELVAFHYDTSIGRSPTEAFLGGEETGLMKDVLLAGHIGWWVPDAFVHHRIRAEQLNLEYVERFYVGIGRWMGLADAQATFATVGGVPRWMLLEWVLGESSLALRRLFTPSTELLPRLKAARILQGRLMAAVRRTRQR